MPNFLAIFRWVSFSPDNSPYLISITWRSLLVSATIFLISVNWTLITVRILESATELELGNAAAFSVFVILTVYLVTNALRLVLRLLGLTTLQEKTALY